MTNKIIEHVDYNAKVNNKRIFKNSFGDKLLKINDTSFAIATSKNKSINGFIIGYKDVRTFGLTNVYTNNLPNSLYDETIPLSNPSIDFTKISPLIFQLMPINNFWNFKPKL